MENQKSKYVLLFCRKASPIGLLLLFGLLLAILVVGPQDALRRSQEIFDCRAVIADCNSKTENQKSRIKPQHTHPAFGQRRQERAKMVEKHIQHRRFGEGIKDANVITAMNTVPRHAFVRSNDLRRAYADHPLPIGLGQTISQPYIVAYMTEALKLQPQFKVLEIGTGSGYQAAVCAEIVRRVYTIEILAPLAESAKSRIGELGYNNVFVKTGDGYFGWPEKGPFDAIIVTCAAGFIPPPLIGQIKADGRMILPLGSPFGAQSLVLITKDEQGKPHSKSLLPVRFVPMVGRIEKDKK